MTAARELLDRLAEIGATVSRVDDRLILRAGSQPVPAALVKRAYQARNELAVAISPLKAEAQFWQRRFVVLTTEWRAGNRDRDGAKRIAWENLANEWHEKHGRRCPACQCAGCGKLLSGRDSIKLSDGNSVHVEPIDCMIDFGRRWRDEAKTALVSLGVTCGIVSEI
jgi:hypothetical protein